VEDTGSGLLLWIQPDIHSDAGAASPEMAEGIASAAAEATLVAAADTAVSGVGALEWPWEEIEEGGLGIPELVLAVEAASDPGSLLRPSGPAGLSPDCCCG
jgi:hypothetical protein